MAGDDDETSGEVAERIPDARPKPTPLWALLSRWLLALEAWLRSHGGPRLRNGLRAFWGLIAAAGLVLLFGPIINPPLTLDDLLDSAETATDTWIARDFTADYTLTRGDDGRLRAEVVETITAFFPDDVDATGIDRVLPVEYEGHALEPTVSDTTVDGASITPAESRTSDKLTLTFDTGQRLSGDHEFSLRYTLQDLAYTSTDSATGDAIDMLDWSVFGPSWPQAFSGLEVSITMPDDLVDRLVRQPRADVAWTLVSGGQWLDPEEDSPPGQTTYSFTVDQNIPPNAQAWFTMPFQPGTFTMPPPSPLFLVQSFGPLLPLAFLLVTLLFSLAARAVAWSDARGRPWFVAESEPPKGVSPLVAAQILEARRARELAGALAEVREPQSGSRRAALVGAARAARRTGRVGDRLRAALAFGSAPEHRAQLADGYRRIPRGFVRDWFLLAPVALTLVQWGLVRQLSEQQTVAVVWWPAAFVLVSTAFSLVVFAIALTARPLTRKGALVKQHLLGLGVYARRTQLLSRATATDRLLPYAVLLDDPRDAGEKVGALLDPELGDDGRAARDWRTRDYLTWPRILVNVLAVALVGGAIAVAAVLPTAYPQTSTVDSWNFETKGSLYVDVRSVDVSAELSRSEDGRGRLDVTERIAATYEDDAPRPPQFAQRLPAVLDGQDLGLQVDGVRIGGADVAFDVTRYGDTVEVATAVGEVYTGDQDVELRYSLTSPVIASDASPAADQPGAVLDRMQWAALFDGWDGWGSANDGPSPVSISFALSPELADQAVAAGWLREDPDSAEDARDWKLSVFPFGTAEEELGPPDYVDDTEDYGTITETQETDGGLIRHTLTEEEGDHRFPTDDTYSDLGVMVEFPAGTFAGPSEDALRLSQFLRVLPILVVAGLALLSVVIAVGAAVSVARRGTRRTPSGTGRDVAWRLGPASALAATIVFVWASSDMPSDWPEFPPLILSAGAGIVAAVVGIVIIRPERTTAAQAAANARARRKPRGGRRPRD